MFFATLEHVHMRVRKSARGALGFTCLLLLLYSSLFPSTAVTATTTLTVTVVYALETHQSTTSSSFSESVSNPSDADVRADIASPADALSSGAPVIVTMYTTAESAVTVDAPLPSGKLAANTFYDFSFTNANTGGAITSFDKPVTLTFFYSDADTSGIDESTLVPHRWNGSSWSALGSYTVDTAAKKITASTQQFSTFALSGTAPAQQQQEQQQRQQSPGGGGGGGGGGSSTASTGVTFSGRAYPRSTVTVLKDAQVAATTVAGADAGFKVSLSGLSSGSYIFSVYAEDNRGERSSLATCPG